MVGSVCWRSSAGHHCEWVGVEILGEHQNSEDSNIVVLLSFGDQNNKCHTSTVQYHLKCFLPPILTFSVDNTFLSKELSIQLLR